MIENSHDSIYILILKRKMNLSLKEMEDCNFKFLVKRRHFVKMKQFSQEGHCHPGQIVSSLDYRPICQEIVGWMACWGTDRRQLINVSLSHWCLSLSLSLLSPSSLSKINKHILGWGFLKERVSSYWGTFMGGWDFPPLSNIFSKIYIIY